MCELPVFYATTEGMATDTSRDHEYTDWAQVARLADELAASVHHATPSRDRVAS